MSRKMSSKGSRASEDPSQAYDHNKLINESSTEKFSLISTNPTFIKEKGFQHLDDFFRKTIAGKGWGALCQPPRSIATMVVREFYANLAAHVLKRVRVRRVLVDFSAKSINCYYNLEPVNSEAFDWLHEHPNYPKVLQLLINGWGEWKLNNEGHAMHFKAKHLAYIPKVWHHFITSRLIPKTNVCEVMAKQALLNFAIIQDIPFDVGQVIEDSIPYNRDSKMNLGHPFLIYGLCKNAWVSLEDNEAWIHSIKAIVVKKDKSGVPRSDVVYDSSHEPSNEEDLTAYQTLFGMSEETPGEADPHPPPIHSTHPPHSPPPAESAVTSPSPTLEDQVQGLTTRLDAFWDETQEHRITMIQDMDFMCHHHRHRSDPRDQQGSSLLSFFLYLPMRTLSTFV